MSAHNKPQQIRESTTATNSTSGKMLFWGDGTPPTSATGYAKGAIYVQTDAVAFFSRMYINKGDETSSNFTYINTAS